MQMAISVSNVHNDRKEATAARGGACARGISRQPSSANESWVAGVGVGWERRARRRAAVCRWVSCVHTRETRAPAWGWAGANASARAPRKRLGSRGSFLRGMKGMKGWGSEVSPQPSARPRMAYLREARRASAPVLRRLNSNTSKSLALTSVRLVLRTACSKSRCTLLRHSASMRARRWSRRLNTARCLASPSACSPPWPSTATEPGPRSETSTSSCSLSSPRWDASRQQLGLSGKRRRLARNAQDTWHSSCCRGAGVWILSCAKR